ncbi:MAG: bifunctional 5,10-methylenetetrahydrofolate dehydrogenase/5,10-methenyltetrahydrofolate cyclohydrolase [Elusimicrobia bacterium]|nr:bifunctional 5,10-methylenetetrahydrofolate dehydrogenase/5,10-methenyltetrahydrofolate cyclohydrolase [Elusimicrobiota bacterium]
MSARTIDGRALALKLRHALARRSRAISKAKGAPVKLALLASGDGAASAFLASKLRVCAELGIEARVWKIPASARTADILAQLRASGADPGVDAIALDLPLPRGVEVEPILDAIPPEKDAEGISPLNYGRLFQVRGYAEIESSVLAAPCTALAIVEMLRSVLARGAGRPAAVIGRSTIVGKPTAHLLSSLDFTVTLCHSKTKNLKEIVSRSEVVVGCAGVPGLIKGDWIRPGAAVLDAGATPVGNALRGDVEYESACRRARWITPVPGGVGPMTTAMLMANTLRLAERRRLPARAHLAR